MNASNRRPAATRCIVALAVSVSLAACAGPGDSPIGEWTGAVTSEGDVTSIVNESGSVWGGTATLVEDLSIGVAAGNDRFRSARIEAVGLAEGRIYVLQDRPPIVRVFDTSGAHLFDFGNGGESPGSFDDPQTMGIDPNGRVIVQDLVRVHVFDLDGNLLTTWPYPGGLLLPITVTVDGTVYLPRNWRVGGRFHSGLMGVAPDGSERDRVSGPEHDFEPWQLVAENGGRTMMATVAYAPAAVWTLLPSGAVAQGIRDRYRFEIVQPGRTLRVARDVEPAAVDAEERAYLTATTAGRMREFEPGWAWTARPIPPRKPAYHAFFGDRFGRLWVHRIVRTDAVADCRSDPDDPDSAPRRSCWRDVMGFDVFDEATGRYLGRVALPTAIPRRPHPVFLQDAVLIVVPDDDGTPLVKRFRIELP